MSGIPKPEYRSGPATSAYSYQAASPPPLPSQSWSAPAAAPAPTSVVPSASANAAAAASSFFRLGPRPESCAFCRGQGHRVRTCTIANEYVNSGRATVINDRVHLPNGQPIPYDGTNRGIKARIDSWLALQNAPPASQTRAVFVRDPPPHFDSRNASTSRIEEVIESHILQVRESVTPDEEEEEFSHDIFEVFATEKKCGNKAKAPELSAPPPVTPAPPAASNAPRSNSQYRYQCDAEDQQLVSELEEYLMQGKLSLTTPAHVLAASPNVRKNVAEKLKVHRVETNEYEVVPALDSRSPPPPSHRVTVHDDFSDDSPPPNKQASAYCLPLQELSVLVNGTLLIPAILDTGSQITVIRHDIAQSLGVPINYQRLIEMEGANGATNWTVGCVENLTVQVGDASFKVNAHVVEHTSFDLLLGQPF